MQIIGVFQVWPQLNNNFLDLYEIITCLNYMYSFLNMFYSFWRLESIALQEYLEKHFLLQFLITNFELIFFFIFALNSV